jgi:hypothetical protein
MDELRVYQARGAQVLLDDRLDRSLALAQVALYAADEAQIALGVDEQLALPMTFPNSPNRIAKPTSLLYYESCRAS